MSSQLTMDSVLHYTSVSHAHSLVGNINKMRLATDLCDVTVVVGNFRILAHRVVLSACTPYFYQMFYTSPKPPSEYRLDNVDETAFLKIIEFCYTSAISVTPDLAWPLLSAAALVELPEICGLCCDLLASDLSLTSCLAMHLSAARLSKTAAAQLLKASSQFLETNVVELSTSQQLFDLNDMELVELFKSLTEASALACVKLATSWLSRSELTIRMKVVDQLKQMCPRLDQNLTDFETQMTASPSVENPCVNGKDENVEAPNKGKPGLSLEKIFLSSHWNDSGYSEPVKRVGQVNEEEDDQQHICIGCGDTFDSSAELLAHRKRECEDDGYGISHQSEPASPKAEQSNKQGLPNGDGNISKDETVMATTSETDERKALETPDDKDGFSKENNLSRPDNESSQTKDVGPSKNPTREQSSADSSCSESSRNQRDPETLDVNDSNNNDINTKTTDVDSSDDIDVVNDDDDGEIADRDSRKIRPAYSIYTEALTGETRKLGQDEGSGFKCQFCGLSVFDDDDELAIHWKDVHGVSQHTSQQQLGRENCDGTGYYEHVDNGHSPSHPYLKRGYNADNDEDKEDIAVLTTLPKQPKLDNLNRDKKGKSLLLKKEFPDGTEIKQWSTKSDDLRVKEGQEENVTGFLQYMKQYNELAKWYMDQGLAYHAKNSESPKSQKSLRQGPREAHEMALDLKQEKTEKGQDIKGSAGSDTDNLEKVKSTLNNDCEVGVEDEEEEGPLDMSKTSQDFSAPSAQFSSRQHSSAKQATEAHQENSSHQSKDAQFLSQHQMELAQYYSRMMAAVAAVSASSGNGNIDPNQYGLAGPYGAAVPGGFNHHAMFMAPSTISTPDGSSKMALGSGSQDINAAGQGMGPEMNVFGASTESSGTLSTKAFGAPFKVPPDVLSYSSQPTGQPFHRRQQQSFHSSAHGLQDVPTATEGTLGGGVSISAASAPYSLPASGVADAGQSTTNGKSQSRKKTGSRQGFPCTVCNRVFSYQAALFTHMRVHSPSARTYQCNLCHRTFDRAPDLKVHVCPNGVEKPYVCPSCGQTFAKNIHLKRHLATHSGLKPYPCWVCGKRFSRSDHLKRHTQSIHAGSRPHGCQLCGKEFVRKYELNKHMLIHTNIVAGEQADGETSLLAKNHLTASPQNLAEVSSVSPGPLTMQLPVTCSTVST